MNKYLKILVFFIFFFFAFLVSPEFKYTRICADQNNPFSCENKWKIEYKKVRFTGGFDIIKFASTGKPINEDYVPVTPITLVFSTTAAFVLTLATVKLVSKKPKIINQKKQKKKNDSTTTFFQDNEAFMFGWF